MSREKVITAVAGYPVLYDASLFTYRDRNQKAKAWDDVAREVGLSVNECKKCWKTLKDTYRITKRKEKDKRKSGAGACGGKPWKFSRVMSFIDPFMEERETESNMGGGEDSESECESERDREAEAAETTAMVRTPEQAPAEVEAPAEVALRTAEEPRRTPQRAKARSSEIEERLILALEAVSQRAAAPPPPPPPPPPPEDSDALFFRSLLVDFQTLSEPTRQDLKFQMYSMVYEAKRREKHTHPWVAENGLQLTTL